MGKSADNSSTEPADVLNDCMTSAKEADSPSIWKPALKEAGWAFAAAAALLSLVYAIAFKQINMHNIRSVRTGWNFIG